jgi:FkbM family methyltransferase
MTILNGAKEAFWELVTLGRGVPRTVDGQTFRVCPPVRWLMDGNKEPELRAFLRPRVRPDDVLIDVGAHAGYYVLLFARWAPRGRVVAFEPNPDTRALLARNVRLNGLTGRVTIEPFAVADAAAERDFFMLPGEARSRLDQPVHDDLTRSGRVTTTTLDDYAARTGVAPDWLLIDIEGYEIAALRGARRLIEARRHDLTVVVEMHPNVWGQSGTNRTEAEQLLRQLRLRPVPLTGQADPLADYGIVHLACDN